MVKNDLIDFVAAKADITNIASEAAVDAVLSGIIHGLKSDQKVTLRNFGIFEVKRRAARTARNPKTGEAVALSDRNVATFKAGSIMKEAIT